jgi:hypothetical protein
MTSRITVPRRRWRYLSIVVITNLAAVLLVAALPRRGERVHRAGQRLRRLDLACAGNLIAPIGSGNRIRGEALGQCAELAGPANL